jgi:tetratricopeptide (TPR) repeat protein
MSDAGYIYVLINPSMEGLIKIGKTTRNPNERIKELSNVTGVPTPFILAFDAYFNNCSEAEQYIHALLEQRGYRVAANREFFNVPLNEVIRMVLDAEIKLSKKTMNTSEEIAFSGSNQSGDEFLDNLQLNAKEPWEDILAQAYAYYVGSDDTLQDYVEAMKLFKQAAKLGALGAYLQLGNMYWIGQGCKADIQTAFEYFKEGAKKGDVYCYAEMGCLFMKSKNFENARKCWKKYFENLPYYSNSTSDWRIGQYGYEYFDAIRKNNLTLEHQEILRKSKGKIISWLKKRIEYNEKINEPGIKELVDHLKARLEDVEKTLA